MSGLNAVLIESSQVNEFAGLAATVASELVLDVRPLHAEIAIATPVTQSAANGACIICFMCFPPLSPKPVISIRLTRSSPKIHLCADKVATG